MLFQIIEGRLIIDNFYNNSFNFHNIYGTKSKDSFSKISFVLQYNNVLGNYPFGGFIIYLAPTYYTNRKATNCIVTFTEIGAPGTGKLKRNIYCKMQISSK